MYGRQQPMRAGHDHDLSQYGRIHLSADQWWGERESDSSAAPWNRRSAQCPFSSRPCTLLQLNLPSFNLAQYASRIHMFTMSPIWHREGNELLPTTCVRSSYDIFYILSLLISCNTCNKLQVVKVIWQKAVSPKRMNRSIVCGLKNVSFKRFQN